ncbi:MAG: radical SAM protein [Candidatus Omnitrophica bacterium]|nr:radical SAM protein [Candidatus Omnitrophota bacterium]
MQILFKNKKLQSPKLSFVLLDWSCRQSFHMLDYLNDQTVARDCFEIIWIEYYDRCAEEIDQKIKGPLHKGKAPLVDQWIVMDVLKDVYYHKHLMYNVGIVASRGDIVCFCDSDAIVKPTFVESILKSFEKDKNIVLHLDQVRNKDKKFYPFNYPSIEEIIGEGCVNFKKGKTTGLWEKNDLIHSRNYGACMCALRQDLIAVGGADEHISYLGHICGPYELTFRLVNYGKKEVWNEKEFLYHVWHPGSDGQQNYLGPHDGKNVSVTALEVIKTKRVYPLLENKAIEQCRLNKDHLPQGSFFPLLIQDDLLKQWHVSEDKFYVSAGRVAFYNKEYGEALEFWKKVKDLSIEDSVFLGEFGWAYYSTHCYAQAIAVCLKALSVNHNDQLALLGLGWSYIQKKDFQQARNYLQKAVDIKLSTNPEVYAKALSGLALARVSLAPVVKGRAHMKDWFDHIYLTIRFYGAKVIQRIKRGDFSIPPSLRSKIRPVVYKLLNKKEENINLLKGEFEYRKYGYPCKVPGFSVSQELDFLLLELPPRYLPMMPNGIAYVHNILLNCQIKFQTIDMNIIAYHHFHETRLRKRLNPFIIDSGFVMKEDPWDNANMSEWEKPEVVDYFMKGLEGLIEEVVLKKPKAVGISLSGNNRCLAKAFVKELRKRVPDIIIVVGGYDCVYYGLGQYLFPDFDYMIIGEAELTLPALAKALAKGQVPKDLIGIVSRYDSPGRVWVTPPLLQDLDQIDYPRYQWAQHDWYQDYERKHLIPITSSRGCHWSRCRFCGECFPFRRRDPLKVAEEIEFHTKKGFHTFHFNESDVNGDPQALYDICSQLIKRKLHVRLTGQLRVDRRNTADYFKHLARAGFTHLRFGVDAWTDNLIKLQNKGYNMNIVFQNLRDCHAAGITTTVNVVIGVPGETQEDVDEAINNMIACGKYISVIESFNTLLLICGSEYHRNPEKYKIHFRKDKQEIYKTYVHYVPTELWYSEDPYIDQEVRMRRMERIISKLHANGVNIGNFATKVVDDLRLERSKALTKNESKI